MHPDVYAVRKRDGKEYSLGRHYAINPASRPPVVWFDLPEGAVDPAGLQIELRFPDANGEAAGVVEFWVTRKR